ncbi:MAG: SulP family inorganic anion transporter [Gallionellaceae bacterium]|jgi:SulP family sulfate permease
MKLSKPVVGDFWGGLAALLVALPSAIAFGVTIYSPLGVSYVAQGALAGILGVMALGLIAPVLGGTNRLITAPCAPAAAVLSAFVIQFLHDGGSIESALLMISLLGLLAGLLQILFGALKLGRLIEYMPYPVVSGFLSGVGLIIISSQIPKFLGADKGVEFWVALSAPGLWKWQSIVIGSVTIAVMFIAPRYTRILPAVIIAFLAGVLAYFGVSLVDPSLLKLDGNSFVIGTLGGGGNFNDLLTGRWHAMGSITLEQIKYIIVTALTLAVLLSIDTLKTCVMLDTLTRSRHDSNRELLGQGIANVVSAMMGGMPGAGTTGATLVNISSGAASRYSGFFEGLFALLAFLLLAAYISWMPVAALAAILIVVGFKMLDRHSIQFLKQRSTIKDFAVIAVVVITALTVSLIAAAAVGVVLAVILFIREQIGGNVVRRKMHCNEIFSKRVRTQDEMDILLEGGASGVVVELQGSLFFGTANQLYSELETELQTLDYVILDMRRVQSVDVTAINMLDKVRDMLGERHGFLIFSHLPRNLPVGRNMQRYFDQVGLVREKGPLRIFEELDAALEWVEDRILDEAVCKLDEQVELALNELELFKGRKEKTLAALEKCMENRSCKAGDIIFSRGDKSDELFLIRKGAVRISLPISDQQKHNLGTFGRGAFFGEIAFLDGGVRSANAVAYLDTELYVLSRKTFETLAEEHKKLAFALMEGIASILAKRLRYTNAELRVLES